MGYILFSIRGYSLNTVTDSKQMLLILISLFIITFPYYYLILLPVHECGHLVFGLLTGYRFLSFRICKLQLIKEDNKLRLCKERMPISDGQCLMSPPPYKERSHPYFFYMMGGTILDAVIMSVWLLAAHFWCRQETVGPWFFAYFAMLELFSVLVNMIPIKLHGINNDAMITLLMRKDLLAIKSWYACSHILEGFMKGKTSKELSPLYFPLPYHVDYKNDLIAYYLLELYQYYIQTENLGELKRCMEQTERAALGWDKDLKERWKMVQEAYERYQKHERIQA